MTDDRAEREIREHQQRMAMEQISTSDHDCPGVHEPEERKQERTMPSRQSLADQFDHYILCCYPDPPTLADNNPQHRDQYRQLRRTFFGGALVMLTLIIEDPRCREDLRRQLTEFYDRENVS